MRTPRGDAYGVPSTETASRRGTDHAYLGGPQFTLWALKGSSGKLWPYPKAPCGGNPVFWERNARQRVDRSSAQESAGQGVTGSWPGAGRCWLVHHSPSLGPFQWLSRQGADPVELGRNLNTRESKPSGPTQHAEEQTGHWLQESGGSPVAPALTRLMTFPSGGLGFFIFSMTEADWSALSDIGQ